MVWLPKSLTLVFVASAFPLGVHTETLDTNHANLIVRDRPDNETNCLLQSRSFPNKGVVEPYEAAGSGNDLPDIVDIPILPKELYLVPYLDELAPYRESSIGKQYVTLFRIVDFIPAWLANIFIPVVFPGWTSALTLNIDQKVDTSIPLGPLEIPTPYTIWIESMQVQNLNTFTTLKPLSLDRGGSFSFTGEIGLKKTRVVVYGQLTVLLAKMDVTITIDCKNPNVGYEFILAFQKQKICEVFGEVMGQGSGCAAWPIFTKQAEGKLWWKQKSISGFRLEDFNLTMEDFQLNIDIKGGHVLANHIRDTVQRIQDSFNNNKAKVLADINTNKERIIKFTNRAITKNLVSLQKRKGLECVSKALSTLGINASRVCYNNYAGFALKWDYMECATGEISRTTSAFPAGQKVCVDVQNYLPYAKPGHVLRTQTRPVGGVVQMPGPPLFYQPDSNSVGLHCSGSTLLYKCEVVSVVPVNPYVLPEAQKFCVYNQAGFAMYTDAIDLRTETWTGRSNTFSASQHYCGDFGSAIGVEEGDEFRVQAQAIGGKLKAMDREVVYKKNNYTVSYICKGSTMKYECKMLW